MMLLLLYVLHRNSTLTVRMHMIRRGHVNGADSEEQAAVNRELQNSSAPFLAAWVPLAVVEACRRQWTSSEGR